MSNEVRLGELMRPKEEAEQVFPDDLTVAVEVLRDLPVRVVREIITAGRRSPDEARVRLLSWFKTTTEIPDRPDPRPRRHREWRPAADAADWVVTRADGELRTALATLEGLAGAQTQPGASDQQLIADLARAALSPPALSELLRSRRLRAIRFEEHAGGTRVLRVIGWLDRICLHVTLEWDEPASAAGDWRLVSALVAVAGVAWTIRWPNNLGGATADAHHLCNGFVALAPYIGTGRVQDMLGRLLVQLRGEAGSGWTRLGHVPVLVSDVDLNAAILRNGYHWLPPGTSLLQRAVMAAAHNVGWIRLHDRLVIVVPKGDQAVALDEHGFVRRLLAASSTTGCAQRHSHLGADYVNADCLLKALIDAGRIPRGLPRPTWQQLLVVDLRDANVHGSINGTIIATTPDRRMLRIDACGCAARDPESITMLDYELPLRDLPEPGKS